MTSQTARVAVVGGGAIGGVWAASLARAGNDVAVLDVAPAVVDAISRDGLVVQADGAAAAPVRLRATSDPEQIGAVDVVYVFVKAQHTGAAGRLARPLVRAHTAVVTQQNGWGNADVLAEIYPPEQIVVGVTYHSATLVAPGTVRHTGRGHNFVGPYLDGGDLSRAERVGTLMRAAGLETTVTGQVKTEIWKKLILNCATLPTSALTRLTAGELGQPGPLRDTLDAIAAEAVTVARALGYEIDLAERLDRIHTLLAGGGRGKASMLQDVEAKRKTEIEVVNGAVVRAAAPLGLDVPLNRAMVALVGGLERALFRPDD